MKKIAVIYESKYGFTEKYARWIAESLDAELYRKKEFPAGKLLEFDALIYGGGLYAGKISGMSFLARNFSKVQGKKVVAFTCGLSDPANKDNLRVIHKSIDRVFTPEMQNKICFFHLRGGIDYGKLGPVHKAMLSMMKKVMEGKSPETIREEDQCFLETYGKKIDYTDRAALEPLLNEIKTWEQENK